MKNKATKKAPLHAGLWSLVVAPVVRTHGRLHVGHVPRLRAQNAQEGGRVRLYLQSWCRLGSSKVPQHRAALGPEVLQFEDDFLESMLHL